MSPDPIYDGLKDGFSIYGYARNNPLIYHDPTGLASEKDLDMLYLSEHVYNSDELLGKKYTKISEDNLKDKGIKLVDEESGFASALYYNNETGKFVYAFRGTDEKKDWTEANIPQSFGLTSEQYKLALKNTQIIADLVGKENLELTGHSLGGGLASFVGTVLGVETTTFNAAGVHPNTLAEYSKSSKDAKQFVTAYYLKGEILSYYQDRSFLPKAIGNRVMLKCSRFQIPNLISPLLLNSEALYRHSAFEEMAEGIQRLLP